MNTQLTDPVCGMTVTPASEHHFAYKDRDYYFCCNGCRQKFAADPEHYLNPSEHAACIADDSSQTYICPMCPEVRQQVPGACPSCGMALEPEAVTGAGNAYRIHLSHAPGSHTRRTGQLPEVRHGTGTAHHHGRGKERRTA